MTKEDTNCFRYSYVIGAQDLEPRYKHVHHAHSLIMMERAREEFLHSIGTSLNEIIASGLFLVLTEINIRYRRELVPGPIVITFEERSIDRRLLSSRQRILVDGDLTAVEAEINMVFMSGTTKRAVLPPPAFARGYLTGRPC